MQGKLNRSSQWQRRNHRQRVAIVGVILLASFCALFARSAYLALTSSNRDQANLALMTRKPFSLVLLAEQAEKIKRTTTHMEDHTISEITGLLTETSRIADQATVELKAQSDAAAKIRANAAVDANVYLETQRKLATTNRLQSDEIVRLNGVLNQALEPSWYASAGGYLITFVGGVVSALLGDIIKKALVAWWRRRKSSALDRSRRISINCTASFATQ